MAYQQFQPEQSRVAVNAIQLFEALEHHRAQARQVKGSMHWKRIQGREYLYHAYTGGKNHSLGPRSAETEAIRKAFDARKAEYRLREQSLKEQLQVHSAYIRANRLNRFPIAGARAIRALQRKAVPFRMIGTNALYAYEARSGVLIEPEHLATADIDVLMVTRQGLRIVTALEGETLLSVIQSSDRSFQPLTDTPFEFRAANAKGYMIDLITQAVDPMTVSDFERHLERGDWKPVGIDSLKWAIASPRFEATVFDERGMPLRLSTVDPRAFVLHKWHVSQQPDREPVKRYRDEAQARLVATLLRDELRELSTTRAVERAFPHLVRQRASSQIDEFDV
ncbi:hypothetical protein HNO52_11175 [Billgrantia diversa]|uniref:GSU2403 family nucleotidyltransferase fold protein n=1 Tax=Halomonas sp. MCCC 1A13316 TaxID=2733487 RepID=UPI0018A3A729|nr:GSU2403 family nucleotidyltransferase fold protein [Halomonas sp. MCCC 1A13316]QOR39015.1 hypothetical protein HNO52_11175 [Halomonas sp. MCCC 1A13316]